ncbi:MAG: type IV secretion system DNA-binding domain-containing protein, partial [Patulibacter sp.]|nr:type IV secretion system DNA-binding domain-containing protein [Patulibacter sp.]
IETEHRKGRRVTREDIRVAEEVEVVEDEMQQVAGATLYSVGIYTSLRCTWGDEDVLRRTAKLRASEYMVRRDARLMRGRRTSLRGFVATLPLARDPLARTTKWAHRDTGNLIPLSSSRCGHDVGLPLGISLPHGTLERLDPFDRSAGTHVTIVTGGSGTGKTFTTNALLLRAIARGMRGVIVDRSSTATGDGSRSASHYDPLLALVPGAARVSIGTGPAPVRINPWDVDDPASPPIERIEALLAIHALLIGDAAAGTETDRRLSADDTALLRNAIQAVYEGCAVDGREPTESLLVDELLARLSSEDDEAMAARITSLLVRLEAYTGDGLLAFLLDEPTNVPRQSPLLLFDIAGVPETLLPAVLMIAMTYIDAEAQRLHAQRLADIGPAAAYSDHLFAEIEEGWKVTDTRVGAAWLNEEARRSRHLAFWLIFVTQQLTDLQGEGGEALLGQAATLIIHKSKPGTIEPIAGAAELTDADLDQIRGLATRKGEFSDAFITTAAGKGRIRIALSAAEFWAIAADPDLDQPARRRALAESGGDPYRAIALLADPSWHEGP